MKRIVISKKFQKKIFCEMLHKYPRKDLQKVLDINSSSIYHMKNGKINSIDIKMFEKIVKLLQLTKKEVNPHVMQVISEKDILKGLDIGRDVRRKQLKQWKQELPKLDELIENYTLDVEKWFDKYKRLMNFGCREIKSVNKVGNKLVLNYTCYANRKKKEFITVLPRKICVDKEFQYFFGLWCGDKAGGGRLGVANKAEEINLYTDYYLKKIYQKPVFQMLLSSKLDYIPKPKVRVDKIQEVKNMAGDYVMVVFAVNSIAKSFFEYLLQNLDKFLTLLPDKQIFFAGLFDAEGNVSLEDRYFRWACRNMKKVEIYKKHLREMGLFRRYDGACLITDNRKAFLKQIYPYMKHKAKINRIKLLFFNEGLLENRFKKILLCINDNPGKTVAELNKIFCKKKIWPQLKFLYDCGYLRREGYPMKLYITGKGLEETRREG